MYVITHSFYAYLVPPIAVGVLLTCQSLEPEYKMTSVFSDVSPRKKTIVLYSGQYGTFHLNFLKTKVFALQENLKSYLQMFLLNCTCKK